MKKFLPVFVLAAALAVSSIAFAQKKEKAPPRGRTQITFEVTPPTALVFVDGKKHGEAGKLTTAGVSVSAGTHAVKLVHGGDEMEADVNVKAGQSLNFRYIFEDSGAGGAPKAKQEKDSKDQKDKKDPGKKDGEAGAKESKKKEELIDLPPDKASAPDEPAKKDEDAKPWKKGGGEEEPE